MSISKPFIILFLILFALPALLIGQVFSNESKTFGSDLFSIGNSYLSLDIEDLNKDGLNEVLFGTDLQFSVFGNNGNLEFEELDILGGGIFADKIVIVDVNGDSYEDLVSNNGSSLIWIENSANGFAAPNGQNLFDATTVILQYKFADIDTDGDLDIIFIDLDKGRIFLATNLGSGQFSQEEIVYEASQSVTIESFYISDIDGDFDMDILTVNQNSSVRLIKNNGANEFTFDSVVIEDFVHIRPLVFPIDIDNDGMKDLVISDDLGFNLGWHKQLNDGTFGEVNDIGSNISFVFSDVNLSDFDQDGDVDASIVSLATSVNEKSEFIWYENDGNGNFTGHTVSDNEFSIVQSEASDIDGDGDVDLVAVIQDENGDGNFIVFENFVGVPSITGCIFFDTNENGIKDNNEQNLDGFQVKLEPEGLLFQISQDGCYSIFVDNGEYEVSPVIPAEWRLTTDSASYKVTIADDSASGLDFGLSPTEQLLAGQMHTVSGITRCNRATRFDFIFQNIGTTIITDGIIWGFPDSLLTVANEINPLDTMVNDFQWGWKFENLFPGQTIRRSIELNIPGLGNGIDPGTLVTMFSATEATDTQGFTNFFKHNFESEILCAYDPNDKLVRPDREGEENYTQFKDTLIYTVRFQNTGNDTAFTVVLRDTLDENLDINTFKILGSSHREVLTAEVLEDRFMTFTFEDILLPDSTVNFNGSQGFVAYSIRPIEGLPEETVIENTASIFFDFNPPIVTNTTQNTLVECIPIEQTEITVVIEDGETHTLPDGMVVDEPGVYVTDVLDDEGCPLVTVLTNLEVLTSTNDLVLNSYVNVVPNLTKEFFNLDIEIETSIDHELVVFNILGEEVLRQKIRSKSNRIDLQDFPSGTYIVQLIDKQNEVVAVKKLVVM